jgi:hypothetical protein
MDEITALHTAARRYCLERAPELHPLHAEQYYDGHDWLAARDRAVQVWLRGDVPARARRIILGDLLFTVEQARPEDFATLEALRLFLLAAGEQAGTEKRREDAALLELMQAERVAIHSHISGLTPAALAAVEPLPYRRVLPRAERERLWRRLERKWGARPADFWYPQRPMDPPAHVIALEEEWFAQYVPPPVLREILTRQRIRRVWELDRSLGLANQYELDTAWLIVGPRIDERYWTSEKMDWLLYASHERSLTVAGEWLVAAITRVWPQWSDHVYTSAVYESPPRREG